MLTGFVYKTINNTLIKNSVQEMLYYLQIQP